MKAAALIAVGLALGAVVPAGADVDLTSLDQRIAQLEATSACQSGVAPFSVQQLPHSAKRVLAATNSGPQTFAKPGQFVWLIVMDPSCAKDVAR